VVYSRKIEEKELTFGVSGRLYKSNVLLYDHQSESLWSQLMNQAISGPMVGKKLTKLAAVRTKWKSWKKINPSTLVLSDDTGYYRNYTVDPYEGYYRIGTMMFPVGDVRRDLAAKERVLGVEVKQKAKAYPLEWLRANPGILKDQVGDEPIHIEVNLEGDVVAVKDQKGNSIPSTFAYWFAWQAFHPDTSVYRK
jgi:hypothetical protein